MEMKRNSGTVLFASALGVALLVALGGCAQQDDSYVPGKRAGFRPQTTPLMQDDFGALDPLAVPSGASPSDPAVGPGFAASQSPPSPAPLPDPVPQPPSSPASPVETRPNSPLPTSPAPPTPPTPPPTPPPSGPAKSSGPEYAKRVPGKPNWIKSPYDGTILDATDQNGVRFPPGTEVKDPKGRVMLVP
jgi:hypothetical protein